MKKVLLSVTIISSMFFASCEKEELEYAADEAGTTETIDSTDTGGSGIDSTFTEGGGTDSTFVDEGTKTIDSSFVDEGSETDSAFFGGGFDTTSVR